MEIKGFKISYIHFVLKDSRDHFSCTLEMRKYVTSIFKS